VIVSKLPGNPEVGFKAEILGGLATK
jgi:hypothetical protein